MRSISMKPANFIRIRFAAVLTGFLMSSPVSADPALFNEAMELDRQDFIEESIGAWNKFLQTEPEKNLHIFAQIKMGIAYHKTEKFLEAGDSASNLAQKYPDHFEVNFHLGNMMTAVGQFPEATRAYEKVVQLRPNEGLGYVGLGLSYFGERKPDPAIKVLRKVRALFKNQKNVAWYQNVRIMIGQIKGFAAYRPSFSHLWLTNNLKVVRDTYEGSVFKAFGEELNS